MAKSAGLAPNSNSSGSRGANTVNANRSNGTGISSNNVVVSVSNNYPNNESVTNGSAANNIVSHLNSNSISRTPSGFAAISNSSSKTFDIVGHHHQLGTNLQPTNLLTSFNVSTTTPSSSPNILNTTAVDSDLISRFSNLNNGISNSQTSSTYRAMNPMSVSGSIVRNSLTNRMNASASNSLIDHHQDIFSSNNSNNIYTHHTNNLTGSSLGQANGSSLLKQHSTNITSASNDIHQQNLAFEPTLNYTTDHSTSSPAHQLYSTNNQHQQQNQNSLLGRNYGQPTEVADNHQQRRQNHLNNANLIGLRFPSPGKNVPPHGRATNLLGFMGLYVGNLSPDLTKEQLEKIFSKYGEPVKAHRLIRSPVAFIKYENTESPRAAIDDLYGLLLPELTLNQDQPLKLHFDRNDAQLKANYRPTDLPKEDNGECYGWRTTVCRRGKSCPKKHIPINRGIDFQMWMIKSSPTPATTISTTSNTFTTIN